MKEDWKECKLSEIMTLIGGGTPKTSNPDYWNGDIPWISVKDFNGERRYVVDTEKKITKLGLENSSTKLLSKGDIIISARGTVGELAIIPSDMAFNQSCYGLRAKEYVDSTFLYYLLKQSVSVLQHNTHGSVFDTITRDTFDGITINLPPLATQQKIATILSSLDDKIELNNKINQNLEQQAQAIFKSWFVDFEPFGGKMPEGWKEKPLYDYADFINGTSFKEDEYGTEGLPIIKIAELKNGITEATQYFNGEKDPKYNVENEDILFSWSGNPDTSIDIFIWSLGNGILNQHTFNVKSYTNNKWFTYCLLKYFKPEFCHRASCKQTTGLGHVTANDLKQITFNSGEKEESNFEALITPIMNQIFNNKIENQKLLDIRDTLLPKLMNGEIEL